MIDKLKTPAALYEQKSWIWWHITAGYPVVSFNLMSVVYSL